MTMFGKFGCCLACHECGKCYDSCYSCICTQCDWYHDGELNRIKQRCFYLDLKKDICWFDYLKIIHSTEKAFLISDEDGVQVWIPSQFVRFKDKDIGITNWIADKKGFFDKEGMFELDSQHFKEYEEQYLPEKKHWTREEDYE